MKRIRRRVVIVALSAGATLGFPMALAAPSAHAMMCDSDIQPACQVVGTVVCGVVAKGRPCLY